MGVADWFETFVSNIRISPNSIDDISYRYHRITKQLNKDYWNSESDTAHSLYVGSYGRDTEIHTSDIDMIFQLPFATYERFNAYSYNGQSALLQEVKSSIEKTYKSSMKADGQVIVISFTDGIAFELVPAFINKDDSYTFPDSNQGGSWKKTDPKPEISEISSMNQICNKNLKRLCRMVRSWKDNCSVPMGGLQIDTLCYNFISDYSYKDKSYLYYDYMSRDFFEYLSLQNTTQEYWLSPGARQYVWRRGSFEYKAKQALKLATEAIENEKEYPNTAKSKWREIYGSKFPN